MMINERIACMWLGHIKTFRLGDVSKLLSYYGTAENVYDRLHSSKELENLVNRKIIKESTKEEIESINIEDWYSHLQENMSRKNIKCTTPADPDFPSRLLDIPDFPVTLYYRGDISMTEENNILGMVGSRRPTHYGMLMAEEFASELSRKGFVIVSGMAMGIDSISHRNAMDKGGRTIAVLGGGVDICYPRTNFDIYDTICKEQLIMSEYEPGVEHLPVHFPARNRLISGLSDGLLVVEAALRSGTLITADYALDQGRSIYAVPGRNTDIMSKGTNGLIRQGAMLVDSPADILMDMLQTDLTRELSDRTRSISEGTDSINEGKLHRSDEKFNKSDVKLLTQTQQKLLGMMGYEPIYIDDLIRANDMNISETIHELKELEKMELVVCLEQSYFMLKRRRII